MLVIVTDEAGNQEDILTNLELAIDEARKTDCAVYILGRESMFGHPKRRVTQDNEHGPTTVGTIDGGPETARLETFANYSF